MALSVNLAQINSAAKGNSDLRETLTGIHLALQSLYAQTGTTPLSQDRRDRGCLHRAAGAFAARGDRGQWQLHRFHHQPRAQCDQRAHLPGAVELARGQLRLGSNDLSRQHQHQLCLAQPWRDSLLAAAVEL